MRGCCICVTGEIKDLFHPWQHLREVGDDYSIRPVYRSVYMIQILLATDLNATAISLLSANFLIYGDVLLVRIIDGFMSDVTFDDIASDLITEICVDAPAALSHITNPAMVISDISSDDFEDEQYDSN